MIGAFPFWKAHRDRKFLESTLPVEIQDHWKKQEELSKKNDAKHWRQSHVLSQWLFASLLLIGLIPGFILAKNMGWGLDAQKVVGLLTAIPIWIAVYLMDRWLVQRRNKKQAQAHENYVHSWEKPQ
jgi:purine-cytosine permease-like protein